MNIAPETVLSVVIPIYNEAMNISELYLRLTKTVAQLTNDYELIFVDDGSNDLSRLALLKIAESDGHVSFLGLSRNFGQQIAIMAGLDIATGEAVVVMDGDLQDPPELIPTLYSKYKEGYEVVYAQREQREGDSFFKKSTAKLFYRLLRRLSAFEFPVDTGDFRLIDHQVVRYLKMMPEQDKFLRGQIAWLGFKQTHVLYGRNKRKGGKTGYTLSKMLKLAMDGITALSDKPLGFVSKAGFIISGISFLIILYALFSYFFLDRTITGWTSLIVSSMFIGGIQLISIGIIGEYIRRINNNTRNRPLYVVKESHIAKR